MVKTNYYKMYKKEKVKNFGLIAQMNELKQINLGLTKSLESLINDKEIGSILEERSKNATTRKTG